MHVCASLICVPSLVEASASAFSFNFHQFISRAGVERYNYNRRISCHKFVRDVFTNDVPNLLDVAGVEDLKFNFLVPDFCPSITLYDDCVLLTVGVVVRWSVVASSKYKNPCRMNGLWKFLTDYGFG